MPKLKCPLFSLAAHGRVGPYYYTTRSPTSYAHTIGIWAAVLIWFIEIGIGYAFKVAGEHWRNRTPQEDALFNSLQHRIPKPYRSSSPRARWTPYTLYMHYRLLMGQAGTDPANWQAKVDELWARYM